MDDRNYHKYNNKRYYTHDGGKTWAESGYDSSRDFFFNHSRQHPYAWHPTDENKVWTFGGDWVVSSQDGGESFIWDNNETKNGFGLLNRKDCTWYYPEIIEAIQNATK